MGQHATAPRRCGVRLRRLGVVLTLALAAVLVPLGAAANPEPGPALGTTTRQRPSGWTTADCGSCHLADTLFSHPVDVTPSMSVPGHLPLADGKLSCGTCHRAESASDHAQARAGGFPLLRGERSGPAFCEQCHDPMDPGRVAMHAIALGRAHLRPPTTIVNFGGSAASADEAAVLTSAECLACHDGSVATAVQHAVPGQDWRGDRRLVGLLPSHPVGVSYPDREGYIRQSSLDDRVRLHEGRVECASCHSLYSAEPNMLVMSNDRSTLCLSCHDK